jgi:hypothetical protein
MFAARQLIWGRKSMGNKNARGRLSARRAATFLAALGALVMSSGVALMVTATPAHATDTNQASDWVTLPGEQCEKTDVSAESGGYTVPAEPEGRDWSKLIIKKGSGNIGVENQVFNNPVAGQTYTWQGFDDKQDGGWSHTILCSVPEPEEQPLVATASATPNTPTCQNNVPSYTKSGTNIENTWQESAAPAFGTTITVTATAVAGAEFAGGATTKAIEVTFPAAATGCSVVETPSQVESTVVVSPPKQKTHTKTKTKAAVTPTVVEAGLGGATVDNMRGEQGLALMVAGMLMLVGAGGLGLRVRGAASRI